jgi:Collagen triple helix repeat (20 copies)
MRRLGHGGDSPTSGRRMSYANVVATMALVLAIGGGTAWAAHHYTISSTNQIAPSVLKKLHGANGKRGTAGVKGTPGTAGADGANGTSGTAGANGTNGTNGAIGSTGAAGANGTALAYVQVNAAGVITQQTGGITMTPGSGPVTGIYCIDVPGALHIGVASGDIAGGGPVPSFVEVNMAPLLERSAHNCAANTTVAIHTYDSTGTADTAGFFVEMN